MTSDMKTSRILLPSAARTADTTSRTQQDTQASALRLYLNVSVAPGTGGLLLVIRGYDKVSGNSVELSGGGLPITQTGCYAFEMGQQPDPATGNIWEAISRSIPYQWDVVVKHMDASSYTYSLSAEILI